ncbi:Ldh family oxidoreductase [Flavilitoribacter nigricans]|uniref:Ldh family oxidoreductase n=1 Tax=Flavilitoribacter nigricans TaxID=70997 RepID=UPI00147581CA|nr:Ldh family oxidoreductase [Flavilitoribacter nigricans]
MRYHKKDLQELSIGLLKACGLSESRAITVADTLIESDLMGHTTHGLALLPVYLKELESGGMARSGEPTVIQDHGASFSWDGNYLPGPYLVHKAIDQAVARTAEHPVVSATIQKAHHIGCLAAYPEKVTSQGLVLLLSCSDPRNATVAPYGGVKGGYSPNPIAAGFPTDGDPILIDISMSATANGYIIQKQKSGAKLPHPWLQDAQGGVTDDPEAFFVDPPATILPLGNQDTGYKGFALGILVEALTNALGGFGRSSKPDNWGGSVFLQVINPAAFGGLDYFKQEMSFFRDNALATPAPPGAPPVRMPGQRGLQLRAEQLRSGVELYSGILPAIAPYAGKYGLEMPLPVVV